MTLSQLLNDHLITWMILVPAVAAIALVFIELLGSLPRAVWSAVGSASAVLTFGLSILLFTHFDPTRIGFQFVDFLPWLPEYGAHYHVGVDGISLPLVLLTAFLVPLVLLSSPRRLARSQRSFIFFTLLLESSLLGAFTSLNLLQFYVHSAVMLIPAYFIIGIWGSERRVEAASKFIVMTALGSLLMLVAILALCHLAYMQVGVWTFDIVSPPWSQTAGLLELEIDIGGTWWQTQHALFAAFALSFAIGIPLVPFHVWLPDAHVEAPAGGSVLLAAVLLKLGAYGFLRFALPLFPVAAASWAPLLQSAAVLGIVYASLLALVQTDLKRLVAYTSVAHLGFVVLGIFAQNLQGMNGSVVQMASHGLFTAGLFFLVGMLDERRGTRELSLLGGIARPMPSFAFFWVLVALAGAGLPLLAGFVGEFLILLGTFRTSPWHALFATVGTVLAGTCMIATVRRLLFGPVDNAENRKLLDLDWREKSVLFAICIPVIGIGVYPSPLLRRIEPSMSALLQRLEQRVEQTVELQQGASWEPTGESPRTLPGGAG